MNENHEHQNIQAPIHSHALKAVATYLAKQHTLNKESNTEPSEGLTLLETLFFHQTLILNAVNSSVELSNKVDHALYREIAKAKGEEPEPEPEPSSSIIIPDRFS